MLEAEQAKGEAEREVAQATRDLDAAKEECIERIEGIPTAPDAGPLAKMLRAYRIDTFEECLPDQPQVWQAAAGVEPVM